MRIAFLATLVALSVPVIAVAQPPGSTSACLKDVPPAVLLNICEHERGRAPMPQPRLYLRLYKDRRGEYEKNETRNVLTKREFKVKEDDIREIERLSATEGVQKALERYPTYRLGIDSSRELTITIYSEAGAKRIILTNFFAADRENKKHYPASLVSLMEKVEEIWDSANGIVVAYEGELKDGLIYSDAIDHVKGAGLKLSLPLNRIFHHAQRIEWTNEDQFPTLRRSGRKYITFRVVSREIQQMTRYRWNDVYTCEIIKIIEN